MTQYALVEEEHQGYSYHFHHHSRNSHSGHAPVSPQTGHFNQQYPRRQLGHLRTTHHIPESHTQVYSSQYYKSTTDPVWKANSYHQTEKHHSPSMSVSNVLAGIARKKQKCDVGGITLPSFQEILARNSQATRPHPSSPQSHYNSQVIPERTSRPGPLMNSFNSTPTAQAYSSRAMYPSMSTPIHMNTSLQHQSGDKGNKRRERWTDEEHALFMQGLYKYGRKWKKIQTYVKTKTAVQVRTHAYGYFAKLLRNMPEDEATWELAEEMSSLPGVVLKAPGCGKRRNEPKTDEAGMDVLRRFVFAKKRTGDDHKTQSNGSDDDDDEDIDDGERTSITSASGTVSIQNIIHANEDGQSSP